MEGRVAMHDAMVACWDAKYAGTEVLAADFSIGPFARELQLLQRDSELGLWSGCVLLACRRACRN